jgi:ketosteroid isomerase-like protein
VLGFAWLRARGHESGAELDVPAAGVYRFRDGLITAIRVYTSRTDALADLGLEEGKPKDAWRTSSTWAG